MRILILSLLVLLSACSKDEPITFTESQQALIGVWQFRYESITDTSLDVKIVLLAINADSSATYRQCIVSKSVNGRTTRSSSRIVSMPDAKVIGLDDNEINLEQQALGFIHVEHDVEITTDPYEENGRWYLGINGTLLEKLQGDEIHSLTQWECPDVDEDDDDDW